MATKHSLSGSVVLSTGTVIPVRVILNLPKLTRVEERELKNVRVALHDLTPQDSPRWIVQAFDQNTLVGIVSSKNETFKFHSTSFQSDTSLRWPRVGEVVDVVTNNNGDLVSVHGA